MEQQTPPQEFYEAQIPLPPEPPRASTPTIDSNSYQINPVMGTFWERYLAVFIDGIIVGIASLLISLVFIIPLALTTKDFESIFQNRSSTSNLVINAVGGIVGVVTAFIYFGYFYTKNGQTPGKKVMNLKVVRADNLQYLDWGKVFLREVIGKYISLILFYLGYLWYFMSEKRQTWHDSLAKTYVVKTDSGGEILVNGPSSYPKEPVKTFLPCGCMALILIIFTASILYLISTFYNQWRDSPGYSFPTGQPTIYIPESTIPPLPTQFYYEPSTTFD